MNRPIVRTDQGHKKTVAASAVADMKVWARRS